MPLSQQELRDRAKRPRHAPPAGAAAAASSSSSAPSASSPSAPAPPASTRRAASQEGSYDYVKVFGILSALSHLLLLAQPIWSSPDQCDLAPNTASYFLPKTRQDVVSESCSGSGCLLVLDPAWAQDLSSSQRSACLPLVERFKPAGA